MSGSGAFSLNYTIFIRPKRKHHLLHFPAAGKKQQNGSLFIMRNCFLSWYDDAVAWFIVSVLVLVLNILLLLHAYILYLAAQHVSCLSYVGNCIAPLNFANDVGRVSLASRKSANLTRERKLLNKQVGMQL